MVSIYLIDLIFFEPFGLQKVVQIHMNVLPIAFDALHSAAVPVHSFQNVQKYFIVAPAEP